MKRFKIFPHEFVFKRPAGTSRGVLTLKKSWFVRLSDENGSTGWGECSVIPGLSPDYKNDEQYLDVLQKFLFDWESDALNTEDLSAFPSILFGLETAISDLQTGGNQKIFETNFTRGEQPIRINGLIWMGDFAFMEEQIEEKLKLGFHCIKMKIGAIAWEQEFSLLQKLRARYSKDKLELRVDANGAFDFEDSKRVLEALRQLEIHSIEQPIRAGQIENMRQLCASTPCPIALDEELIGDFSLPHKKELLAEIRPQYIILKPSLHGGISGTQAWIECAESLGIKWWMTSALESNLGLNAIAQLASTYDLNLPQGLGTGSLYHTNLPSPLSLEGEFLHFNPKGEFDFSLLEI